MRRFLRLLSCLSLLLAASCTRAPEYPRWTVSDLRLLDPVDAPDPAADVLAVYARTTRLSVEIRIDLLDIAPGDSGTTIVVDLYDNRNFASLPLVIIIPAKGMPRTFQAGSGSIPLRPRIVRSYALDTLTVRLNRGLIGDRFRVSLRTYGNGDPDTLADETGEVRSDSLPPPGRAPLLLAFREAFPAVTPAQALRRWDGAHAGPNGGRHGLKYLLEAADRYDLPVALLDLKDPASLAALDTLGIIARLQDLLARDLLILPDLAYADPADAALDFSRRAAAGFGLPGSAFVYAPDDASPGLLPGSRAQFISLPDPTRLSRSGATRLIPLPAADAVEATEDGPALDVRRALAGAATSPDPSDLVVLGGSLPNATWGIPDMANPTFAWLAGHPWVHVLDGYDLQTFPLGAASGIPEEPAVSLEVGTGWLDALRAAPRNEITDLAWQAYLTLTAPSSNDVLKRLRLGYLGQVGELLAASDWAAAPYQGGNCSTDLDLDGGPDCILANDRFFAVIDPSAANLTQLFYLDGSGPHQLVGPSSQFAVGLSDPSTWDTSNGVQADPSVIPGAFFEGRASWYEPTIGTGIIIFGQRGADISKIYRLTDTGIEVTYQFQGPVTTRIPLALDPQAFYFGPTRYQAALSPSSWTWSLAGGPRVEVRTDASLSAQGFTASLPFLSFSENPDRNYPAGHYYPFPLSIVEVRGEDVFHVWISVK